MLVVNQLYDQILEGMLDFIDGDDDADYTSSDVEICGSLLSKFISSVPEGISQDKAMVEVKTLVLALNELNEQCDFSLIETDQREGICELIFQTLASAGVEFDEDVTEEWREW